MPPFLPFPKDVEGECKRAARYLYKVAQPAEFQGVVSKVSEKATIPPNILKDAKGIAVFKVLKGGFIWSGRMGAGLAVAKLPDGRWSVGSSLGRGRGRRDAECRS
jgi:lipid-binding SYLF domain-containing protein